MILSVPDRIEIQSPAEAPKESLMMLEYSDMLNKDDQIDTDLSDRIH